MRLGGIVTVVKPRSSDTLYTPSDSRTCLGVLRVTIRHEGMKRVNVLNRRVNGYHV